MGQPTKYSTPTLSKKEANPISHDDFSLVAAAKVIMWTREAQLVFKDIEGMSMDAAGTKSAIIELAYHVSLIDRVTNALDFSNVLDSAKARISARYLRTRPLKEPVENAFDRLVKRRGADGKLPTYKEVIRDLEDDKGKEVTVDWVGETVTYRNYNPISFRTIKDWLKECREKN